MANQHEPKYGDQTVRDLQTGVIEEIEIEELDTEVGFIISTSCCSLELEEDEDLLEDAIGALEVHSTDEVTAQAAEDAPDRAGASDRG